MDNAGLFDRLSEVPGIPARHLGNLQKLGLNRVLDVLFFFPRDYEDHSELKPLQEIQLNENASVIGEVVDQELVQKGNRKSTFYLLIRQGNDHLRAIWFNQPYRAKQVIPGQRVMISGKIEANGLRWESVHPRLQVLGEDESPDQGSYLPVYRLTEGLNQTGLQKLIQPVIESFHDKVEEVLPETVRSRHDLLNIRQALWQIHFPENSQQAARARTRFVFQELLTLQLALHLRRRQVSQASLGLPLESSSQIDARIRSYFPFNLTSAQERAISEICLDLGKPVPMNRLLQGDVGSGKTIVAIYALMLAVANGAQGVLMAPTETLARQHYRDLQELLVRTRVEIGLLTGSLGTKDRKAIKQRIASGETGIVIGTQALIQNELEFDNLAMVIVDEQHRFGVKQRAELRQKSVMPHYLVMTATPIPRTVSMTLFGDLDVSLLDELPPDRIPVKTYLCEQDQQPKWWEFVRKKIREGRQAFVVAPLVEEGEANGWDGVEETFENLCNGELADFKVDLLHGRQSADEKETSMLNFAEGETQVLVATSVVEVGINVPNATVMTVLSASRFGLSQLHQLRGRVGRGKHPGYVALFDSMDSEQSRNRLGSFAETNDGFKIAELDFGLRGPGDLFGTKQHGMPPLYVADLIRDQELLIQARKGAIEILESDPNLQSEDFKEIRNRIFARYGESLELSDVG